MKQIIFYALSLLMIISCSEKEPEPDLKSGYVQYQNNKYSISKGYLVWFSELDCGNFDVFAHSIYLTDGIEIQTHETGEGGAWFIWTGKGNICCVNLFCKSSTFLLGTYTFVDSVECNEYWLNNQVFTIGETDKLGACKREINDPTHFAFGVDLTLGWENIMAGNDPTTEDMQKYNNYVQKRIGIKSGSLTVTKDGTDFILTISCETNDGKLVEGEYKGPLTDIQFGI